MRALQNATTGSLNTACGQGGGRDITTGSKNSILGTYSGNQGGLNISTSSNNIVLSDGDGNVRGYFNSSGTFFIGTFNSSVATSNSDYGAVITAGGRIFATVDSDHHDINRASSDGELIRIRRAGSAVGSISVTNSGTSFNTSSDYRIKENVANLTGATERLKQLEPKRFNFISDADTTVDGFLAHEVSSIVPEAITGTKDAVG